MSLDSGRPVQIPDTGTGEPTDFRPGFSVCILLSSGTDGTWAIPITAMIRPELVTKRDERVSVARITPAKQKYPCAIRGNQGRFAPLLLAQKALSGWLPSGKRSFGLQIYAEKTGDRENGNVYSSKSLQRSPQNRPQS